jgi:uncharacterized protein YbjT (DUF2867 family)
VIVVTAAGGQTGRAAVRALQPCAYAQNVDEQVRRATALPGRPPRSCAEHLADVLAAA